jgi:hypothetical protein
MNIIKLLLQIVIIINYLFQGSDMAYLSNLHSEFDSSPDYVKVR